MAAAGEKPMAVDTASHAPIDHRLDWLETLGAFAALRPRQRRLLGLFASGHSYEEIVATTATHSAPSTASWRAPASGSR